MRKRKFLRKMLCTIGLLGIAGCGFSPNVAFPPAKTVAASVGPEGVSQLAFFERGRKIYTTSCTECHVARTIANYSVPQWRHYVAIMAPRAGLEVQDRAALEAYVVAARQSLPTGGQPTPSR